MRSSSSGWLCHVFEWHARRTERALAREPEIVVIAGDCLHRDTACGEEVSASCAEYEERASDDRCSAVSAKFGVCPPQRGSGAHHIVDHCDSLPPHSAGESRRKPVPSAIQAVALGRHYTLGEAEFRTKCVRNELRQEGAAEKRSADHRYIVRSERGRQCRHERLDPPRLGEQRIEIEPERTMVPRLKPEVPASPIYDF